MLIYSPHITPRLRYIAAWLGEQTGTTPVCTNDQHTFSKSEEIKINYSQNRISPKEIWIKPEGLINETGIELKSIFVYKSDHAPLFFTNESDLGFDYLSAVFYLISRYEEYLPFENDAYGRFPHIHSLAYINGFLQRPLVDEWTIWLLDRIRMIFPEKNIHTPFFNVIPTYDIDISWSYIGKGLVRNLGGALRNPKTSIERMLVLAGRKKDPFDTYSFLEEEHAASNHSSIYFFLTAPNRSELDKNISPSDKRFCKLVQQTATHASVGIHPSVYSHESKTALQTEKNLLASICQKPITKSRFHYLKFLLPKDYRRLIESGITDDYTMGYGTINGFRASVSRSFLWYDLEKEETTSLRIHPFCWMDANSHYEMHLQAEDAYAELMTYLHHIKQVNGTMITVSHNHLLGNDSTFKGWKERYRNFLIEVSARK